LGAKKAYRRPLHIFKCLLAAAQGHMGGVPLYEISPFWGPTLPCLSTSNKGLDSPPHFLWPPTHFLWMYCDARPLPNYLVNHMGRATRHHAHSTWCRCRSWMWKDLRLLCLRGWVHGAVRQAYPNGDNIDKPITMSPPMHTSVKSICLAILYYCMGP
jgi:hypothetical protein